MSEAFRAQDYKRLGAILRFAYDRFIILHLCLSDVLFLVNHKEVEVMRVLVKAVVVLKDVAPKTH